MHCTLRSASSYRPGFSINRLLAASIAGCLLLALVTPTFAAPLEPIRIWPGHAPNEQGDIGAEITQPPRPGDPTIRLTNVTQPTITVYRPAAEKNTGTAVVICPGGGYRILAYNKEGTDVAEWLNTLGVTGIVLKYRVPARKDRERYAAPLEDVQRAIGLARQHASEWDIDPDRIGVMGFSAGGHLSASISNNFTQRTYAPLDEADRFSCRPDFAMLIYPAYLVDKSNQIAAELKVTAQTPPSFIVQTEDDGVRVECGLHYYQALKNAKVPAEMHLYAAGGHGYGLRAKTFPASTWPARAEDWLKSLGLLEPKK